MQELAGGVFVRTGAVVEPVVADLGVGLPSLAFSDESALSGKTHRLITYHFRGHPLVVALDEVLDHVLELGESATSWRKHHIPDVDRL